MEATIPYGTTVPSPPLRVLILEDNPRDAKLTAKLLGKLSDQVKFDVTDSPEFFRAGLERAEYDVILADFNLQNWTALDALEILRQSGKDIPLIVVTGSLGDESAVECIKQGAADFILKDRPARLPAAVQRALEERKLRVARKLAEAENARLALIVNSSDDAIFSVTPDVLIATWNAAAEQMYGYAAEEIKGAPFSILVPEDGRTDLSANNARLFRGESLLYYEQENLRKDGTRIQVLLTLSPIRNGTGNVTGVSAVARDITERKRVEDKLQASEIRYRRLFESAHDGILILDADSGEITDVNPFLTDLLGYTRAELLGKKLWEIGPLHDVLASKIEFKEMKSKGIVRYEDLPLKTRDGRQVDVEFVSNVYLVDRQTVIQCNIRDISERKRAQAENARLVTAVEQCAEAVVITDPAGTIEYVNPAFTQITGYSREEALGQNPRVLKSGEQDPSIYQGLWTTILKGEIWRGEIVNRRKDGRQYTEEMSIAPVRNQSGEITNFIATKQDVTEHKSLEAKLRQAAKMEAVGALAGGVAHDFNNLLTVINGYAELLLESLGANDKSAGYIKEIVYAGERAASLVRQLLAFSRGQASAPQVLDLNSVVCDLEKMLTRLIGADVELRTVLAPSLGRVKADPGQIEQVVVNLVVNACDAMPIGGKLTLETRNVELGETFACNHFKVKPGPYVELAISDTGVGMAPATLAHVFEPFFTTKEQGKGTGLGLATAYGIVKRSQGGIEVCSELGHGTIFKVYLPSVSEELTMRGRSKASVDSASGSETILLVEDDEGVRSLIRLALVSGGYVVLETKDAESALVTCASHKGPIHLLLTDIVMPQMSGPAVAQKVAASLPDIKVLYMSGYTEDAIVHHGVYSREVRFIQKPFTPIALRRKIRDIFESNQEAGVRTQEAGL